MAVKELIAGTRRSRLQLTGAYVIHGRGRKAFVEYEVECKCGVITWVRANSFWGGHSKSCGCLKLEKAATQGRLSVTHGMSKTPEWDAYVHAEQRCTNPKDKGWKNYGGRGIKFLFSSFEKFYKELGCRPKGKSLDRKNNNGNYEPGNVRWATSKQQANNRRSLKGKPWSIARRAAQHV